MGIWDVLLYGVSALVAVNMLVRLMQQRRDQLAARVRKQIAASRRKAEAVARTEAAQRAA